MNSEKRYTAFLIVLIIILCGAMVGLLWWGFDYAEGSFSYEQIKKVYIDEAGEPEVKKLQNQNPDIKGWIKIEGTNIDYPLLWSGNDNDYLRHTCFGDYNVLGSIFIWQQNNPDFSDQNTLVFGHNTWNGQMFGQLKKYKKQSFFESHSVIVISMPEKTIKYKIVSAYTTTTGSDIYSSSFKSKEEYKQWLNDKLERSVINTSATKATGEEQTIVLSTCAKSKSNKRFVVVAERITSKPVI